MYLHEDIKVEEDLVDGVDEGLVHEGLAVVVDLGHLENKFTINGWQSLV